MVTAIVLKHGWKTAHFHLKRDHRVARAFPCNKNNTGDQTVKTLVEQWFEHYRAPKEVHSDKDVRIRSDTGWYKRVPDALKVHVTTGVPYTNTSNPPCERQDRVVEQNLRILLKQGRTKHWVRLLPWAVLTMNTRGSSSTGYTLKNPSMEGVLQFFFKTAFPEEYKSPVRDWLEHRQDLANLARAHLKHVQEGELTRRNRTSCPASFNVGDLLLVHHSRLPTCPRNCLHNPFFGPYHIIKVKGSRIHVRCSPRLVCTQRAGTLLLS